MTYVLLISRQPLLVGFVHETKSVETKSRLQCICTYCASFLFHHISFQYTSNINFMTLLLSSNMKSSEQKIRSLKNNHLFLRSFISGSTAFCRALASFSGS
jgi:hypothetical protein